MGIGTLWAAITARDYRTKISSQSFDATAYTISRARLRHYLARLPVAALRIDTDIADHAQAGLRVIDDIIGLLAPLVLGLARMCRLS